MNAQELNELAQEVGGMELGPEELGFDSEITIEYDGLNVRIYQDGDDEEGYQAYSWEIV